MFNYVTLLVPSIQCTPVRFIRLEQTLQLVNKNMTQCSNFSCSVRLMVLCDRADAARPEKENSPHFAWATSIQHRYHWLKKSISLFRLLKTAGGWRSIHLLLERHTEAVRTEAIQYISFASPCSSSGFPFVGVRLAYLSIRCTFTFVNCFHWSLWLVFSHNLSSSSAFLRLFVTQSSHHSCGLPRFLRPSCLFLSDIFGNSSYVSTQLFI